MAKESTYTLWLPKWFPNKLSATEGIFILEHAKALNTVSKEKVVILFCKAHGTEFIIEHENIGGILIVRSYYPERYGIIGKLSALKRFNKAQGIGYKYIEKEFGVPTRCHVHVFGRQGILAWRLRQKQQVPYFISTHWTGFLVESEQPFPYIKKRLYKFLARHCMTGSAVSEHLLSSIRRQLNLSLESWRIIPNVISPVFSRTNTPKKDEIHMVHISTLKKEHKQFDKILNAFLELAEKHTNLHLHVFGGNEEAELSYSSTIPSPLKKNVHFQGVVGKRELAQALSTMDFGIFFSKYETQCLGILECLSAGLPCIVPKIPAVEEYFDSELGILISPSSTDLTRVIQVMLDTYKVKSKGIKNKFDHTPFSLVNVGKSILKLYESEN